MKKTDAHQWVQSLANIGVIASIIFLSVQVSQNRRSLDDANKINLVTLSSDALENYHHYWDLTANEQLAQVWVKGRAGEQLTPVETVQFNSICLSLLWANAWAFQQMPNFGRPESAAAVVGTWRQSIEQYPGIKTCWDGVKQVVDAYGYGSFVKAVEDTRARPPAAPVPPLPSATPIKADDEKQR